MKIYELLDRDPRTGRLANNGQARIIDSADDRARAELRAELETFVCDGRFGDALQRILDRYLANLGTPRQDSAWISGFFGSGKSHLLKMLVHLWVNTRFDDGSTARGLVRGGLPDEVEAQLRELDIHVRRAGKPAMAAADTLLGGSVDHVRHTVLSILLRACGWPAQYPQAMFCFWLREQNLLDPVRAAVQAAGRDWIRELNDLYVSPVIARALIQAAPDFAADEKAARQVLVRQYPQLATDITTQQFIEAARKALAPDGQLPLTLLALDEVQQYINESADRAAAITEATEALQTQFDSRVMLVAAGQSALSAGTHALMWLRDRFRVTVELTDADVEVVTRKVLLRKKPSGIPALEKLFDAHAGEVARHLQGSRIGQRPEDRPDRISDYPLLPTRRRFWEACFRAADAPGSYSQLRSQLRILHDSLHDVAERDLGAAIPASDLFDALAPSLVNTGVLLNEINTRIQKLDNGTEAGRLRRDLCGLVFLIGKLPRQEGVDLGARADTQTLADLLVRDITVDSGPFRKRVDETLGALAGEGVLMKVGEEFRLQTTEGAEWDRAFRERQAALRQNEVEIAARRDQLFGQAVQAILAGIKLSHGEAKLRRTLELHAGGEAPPPGGDQVTVWPRDGWSCARRDVESEARRRGPEDPMLHAHLPKRSADELKDRIIDAEAAQQVLHHKGVPASPEGNEARESMDSRRRVAESSRDGIVREVIRAARMFQGGGSEVFGEGLAEKIATGAQASLARLFPRFDEGDHRAWEPAVKRARDGSDQPFKVVGWDGATEEHPVSREVLARAGAGARGTDLHKALKSSPYGWPQDAIDAALIALHRSGHLRATRSNGQPVVPGSLDQAGVKGAEFRAERVRLTTSQRIALRGLFGQIGVAARSGEEEARAAGFLDALVALAARAGGEAPLPAAPDTRPIEGLKRLAGTEQLGAILDRKDAIAESIRAWTRLAERAEARRPAWALAIAMRHHAEGLPILVDVGPQLDAVVPQRSLLDDSDHVGPLVSALGAALRERLTASHAALTAAVQQAAAMLAADVTWTGLDPAGQAAICREVGLVTPPALQIGTDDSLRRTLDARPLSAWRDNLDAVPHRIARALDQAAARLPAGGSGPATTIAIRRGTLADEGAVRAWLAEHEEKLVEAVRKGPVIVS
ncbi:MAG TPA: BREX system P-loop protein BrxC [Candidatus Binatia bacterium]|nr:BREX system P-loop protein BrxC [Candidatus Binatia bacterium]